MADKKKKKKKMVDTGDELDELFKNRNPFGKVIKKKKKKKK